jgi:hypothetical protein
MKKTVVLINMEAPAFEARTGLKAGNTGYTSECGDCYYNDRHTWVHNCKVYKVDEDGSKRYLYDHETLCSTPVTKTGLGAAALLGANIAPGEGF